MIEPILVIVCGTILLVTVTICGTKIVLKGMEIDKINAERKKVDSN